MPGFAALLGQAAVYGSRIGLTFVYDVQRFNNWTYTNLEFLSRYRFDKQTVSDLDDDFWESGFCGTKTRKGNIHMYGSDERLQICLRYLSSGADFKSIGDGLMKTSKTTTGRCVWEVVDFLYFNHERYIRWPQTPEELAEKAAMYEVAKYRWKPQVVGAVDCMQVAIRKPDHNWDEEAFVNRKNYHSINVMLVVDAHYNVLHVDPRFPGSASDAYIFNCSEVRDYGDRGFFGDYFILGDLGFRQRDYVFTPFYGAPENLTQAQKSYNSWHAVARSPVEMTNGQIKQRFRLLDSTSGVIDHNPDKVCKLIMACVCLHNLAKKTNQAVPPEDPYFQARIPDAPMDQPDELPVLNQDRGDRRARYVRQHFAL